MDEILSEAWEVYREHQPNIRLGQCIRVVCSQFATKEHKYLSNLDGEVALCYFKEHYNANAEQQLTLLGE
jgi:hypothetical protein